MADRRYLRGRKATLRVYHPGFDPAKEYAAENMGRDSTGKPHYQITNDAGHRTYVSSANVEIITEERHARS